MKQECWLIFREGSKWSKRYLKSGFGHVDILMKDDFNWYVVRPRNRLLEVKILDFKVEDNVPLMFKQMDYTSMMKVNVEKEFDVRPTLNIFHLMNCVGIAKYMLGLFPYVFTPWQLYKYLNKIRLGKIKVKHVLSIEIV